MLPLNGPCLDDGDIRGVSSYGTTEAAALRALLEADPAVRTGRLVYELIPSFGIPGDALRP